AGGLFLIVLATAGQAAAALTASLPAAAWVSLGAGFWVLLGAAGLALVDSLQRARAGVVAQLGAAALIAAGFALMAEAGVFDALSLAREYCTRQDVFAGALIRHIVLVAAAVGPALLIGFPLGVTAARQLVWRVEVPWAAPGWLAGLRSVLVRSIGLAVVAALIGAGGLGNFVFGGLGRYAADLVLLGALPAIGLALAADFLLQLVSALLWRREPR